MEDLDVELGEVARQCIECNSWFVMYPEQEMNKEGSEYNCWMCDLIYWRLGGCKQW